MENKIAQGFYGSLAEGRGDRYLVEARRFIPRYDEIAEEVTDLLQLYSPAEILDIGSGIGNIEGIIFSKLPKSRVTCVEASPDMAQTSRLNLSQYGDRANIINMSILDFVPEQQYDAILSNIALHNVPYDRKEGLIGSVRDWLNPEGVFVWSDLIKYANEQIQGRVIGDRLRFAMERGASEEFARENFEKEGKHDYPLTTDETLELLRKVGFERPENVWLHGAFEIFYARK